MTFVWVATSSSKRAPHTTSSHFTSRSLMATSTSLTSVPQDQRCSPSSYRTTCTRPSGYANPYSSAFLWSLLDLYSYWSLNRRCTSNSLHPSSLFSSLESVHASVSFTSQTLSFQWLWQVKLWDLSIPLQDSAQSHQLLSQSKTYLFPWFLVHLCVFLLAYVLWASK